MMTNARIALTRGSATDDSKQRPKGMPNNVETTSQPALRTWTFCQSWTRMTTATVIEARTASGAATSTGMTRESNGTATSASPKPKAERITVAMKINASTRSTVQSSNIHLVVLADDDASAKAGDSL